MREAFGESVERGTRRGEEIAAMDAAIDGAQERFLALCREWIADYASLADVETAYFDLYGLPLRGSLQVTVKTDGRVSCHGGQFGKSDLTAGRESFARPLFGFYENSSVPDDLSAEIETLMAVAERSMASVLEQVASYAARRRASGGTGESQGGGRP